MSEKTISTKQLVKEYKSEGAFYQQVMNDLWDADSKGDYAALQIATPEGPIPFDDFVYWVEKRMGYKITGKYRIENRIIVED